MAPKVTPEDAADNGPTDTPSSYIVFSVLIFLINTLFGCPALLFSILSMRDSWNKRRDEARKKGTAALTLNLAGLIMALVIVTGVMCWYMFINRRWIRSKLGL